MSHDTNLAADHGVSADLSASGYPGLGSNDRVFSYFHIVGHLDQIVQLHTFANNGSAHCGPVNGIIGANLHIVFNNHISNLAHLGRSEEHTSELQSLMRISYAVFCLKKKKHTT